MTSETTEHNRRVLIVDDNAAIHDDFRKILAGDDNPNDDLAREEAALFGTSLTSKKESRFELASAFQGQEALEKVRAAIDSGKEFALAFVDVRMPPGWDGVETTARLWEADPDLQIVMCTAYSDYSWSDLTRRLGTPDKLVILKKPFDVIEVLQLANGLTEKRHQSRQARQRLEFLERIMQQHSGELLPPK